MNKLEEEKKYISELYTMLTALHLGMNMGLISEVGIREIYEMLTDFRRSIHHIHEKVLQCGCYKLDEIKG